MLHTCCALTIHMRLFNTGIKVFKRISMQYYSSLNKIHVWLHLRAHKSIYRHVLNIAHHLKIYRFYFMTDLPKMLYLFCLYKTLR